MSVQEEWFLDVMENLSSSLDQLLLPGSCCVLPSSCGRLPVHGGQVGGSTTRGLGPLSGKDLVKVSRKGKGKVMEVDKPEVESEEESELGEEEGEGEDEGEWDA